MDIIESKIKYDVIVCGCGSAGFCAAVAAARSGMRTAVVEKYYTPGGIMTVLGNNSVDQFNNPFRKDRKMIISGIGWEFVLRLYRDGFAHIPDMDAEYVHHAQYGVKVNPVAAAKVIDDLLIEAGVDMYYGQPVVEVLKGERKIDSVVIAVKDGLKSLAADIFIDCTGDGDMAHLAGAESEDGDGRGGFQPGTLRYYPAAEAEDGDRILNFGDNKNHVTMDSTDSDLLTRSEVEARRMIYRQMSENNMRIMAAAPAAAPREGRRIKGLAVMTAEDYCLGKQYDDSVCYSFWFIDIHRDGQPAYIKYLKSDKTPSVRLSSMISSDFSNLMMAGRCISADRETNSAIRVKASCMAMGQAAGAAAALAIKDSNDLKDLSLEKLKVILNAQGAIVPGISDGKDFRQMLR